tara:strand:- start:471 stop:1322 length:852 start_codon:yes stop_codon:yes gene_type:complete
MAWFNRYNSLNFSETDSSDIYTSNNRVFLYIGNINYKKKKKEMKVADLPLYVIMFKPFIKAFEIDMTTQIDPLSDDDLVANQPKVYKGVKISYKLSLSIPCLSLEDAKITAGKISIFNAMLTAPPQIDSVALTEAQVLACANGDPVGCPDPVQVVEPHNAQNIFYVSLGNLIQSGRYTNKRDIKSDDALKTYGLRCEIHNLTTDIDTEAGFFEENNKIYPKSYTLTFSMKVLDKLRDGNSQAVHIRGFDKDGGYTRTKTSTKDSTQGTTYDIKSWPFGVSHGS